MVSASTVLALIAIAYYSTIILSTIHDAVDARRRLSRAQAIARIRAKERSRQRERERNVHNEL